MAEEPPSLPVGTGVSAKYKGAFCEAKIRKVVRSVKCKVLFKNGLGNFTVCDDQVKGTIRNGSVVEVRHPEKKEFSEATITKIQDCSQYTVVFDDGDITTLRRTALCLKSGKHFAESETLDQLPLTHPEHFSTPVIGGRRGRRARVGVEASSDEEASFRQSTDFANFKETDIGRVVCVEGGEKRKNRENWFPGLIVAPTAQESVPIRVRDEYLVRSFKDGRYYTVPKKEILEFSPEMVSKSETNSSLKSAIEKAIQFMDRDELPLHWDRDLLFYGVTDPGSDSGEPGEDNESSDDEPREKKDHFVAQLYKFMDENGTPINEEPVIGSKDVDLFRLYKVVTNLGGFNRITNQNNWKNVSVKLGFGHNPVIVGMVKQSYRKYLLSFEEWPKRPGCSMQIQPRLSRSRSRIGRTTVIKDRPTTPSVKNEKEKVMEKNSPAVSEPKPGPSGIIKEPPLIKPPITPVVKDKPATKRTAQHVTPPTLVKSVGDTYAKTPLKEIKVEPGLKLRNPKQKQAEPESLTMKQEIKQETDNQVSGAIAEAVIAAVKDKKKRVGVKEKPKKDVPLVKGGKVDCLANTRQKRTIKERLKGVGETVKVRGKASLAGIAEIVEKVHPSKSKVKDEGAATKINKKEEVVPVSAASEEKRKGRKRKEKSEITLENYDVLPTYKTISLGDKLKVYYGPTKEAKITSYEAKVLQTKEENGETLYFVHYTGWNTRYDEWIRASRIADNLSWVAGKASKKQSQVSAPKSAKREKKSTKNENLKGDYKTGTNKDVAGTSSASGSSLSSSKDNRSNRQGSVGRSTTPSSIASSSSRSKGTTHKRPATRAAQTRKDDETTQDFESDGGSEIEESKNITVINTGNIESNTSFQSRNKNPETSSKDEILPDVGITIKVEELEPSHIEIKEVSSLAPMCDVDAFKREPIDEAYLHHLIVKSEDDTEEDDNTRAEDDAREDEDFEELTRITIVKEEPLSEDPVEEDHSSNIATAPDYEAPIIKEEEVEEEDEEEEYDDGYSKSRSGSDNSCGGEESAPEETVLDSVKTEVKIENEYDADLKQPSDVVTKEVKEVAVTVTSNDTDTEDVYEFKEPEPFEFEARKSSDDKGKAVKRAITLSVDDKPPSPKMKRSLSPADSDTGLKSSSFDTPADLLKDDTSPESTPTIQTCEEAFDKICASPLRAAALDSRHMAMLERMENYDDDDDNFDDDSEDRLVISERDSDNCSNGSFDKDSEILAAEYSNSATEVNELKPSPQHDSQSKEPFPKGNDDDDDEEMEDEAINNAIQTAMHLETSEDSSEEEMIPNEDNTVSMTEVESVKMEENDSSSEMQDLKNSPSNDEENKADDNSGTDESPPHLVDETEKDRIEASIEQEDDTQKESDVIDICPAAEAVEENITAKEEDGGGMIGDLNNSENADVEEDENNIESLICEETIPGSPPSHLEVLHQIEEKHQTADQDIYKNERDLAPSGNLNEPDAAQQLVQVVRVERSPPTTPESDAASSSRSPLPRESEANAPLLEKKAEKEAVVAKPAVNESSQYKKESTKTSATESRSKKVEVKAPAKRGRKSKKKNDDSGPRRKYSRHSKHHGSESDDTYDPTGGSGRGESSRSTRSSPHLYHHNFLIPTDKLSALDVSQRIVHINQAMQELRTTYNNQKTELAAIDKRRKRIRRREREDAARLVNARSH